VHDHHRWHVEDGEVIRDAEISRIDVILEGGDVRIDQVEQPDDIEQPHHRHRGSVLITDTGEREQREHGGGQVAIGHRHREGARQLRRD
jgi:hypothetical protein